MVIHYIPDSHAVRMIMTSLQYIVMWILKVNMLGQVCLAIHDGILFWVECLLNVYLHLGFDMFLYCKQDLFNIFLKTDMVT